MSRFDDAVAFLEERGAAEIDHPGGTLLAHLRRTAEQLAAWDAREALVLAGLCHAVYGTDGFPRPLIPWTDRSPLAALIGDDGERIVYLYAACDRDASYPRVGRSDPLVIRDRFAGVETTPEPSALRDFFELTFANELDIVVENPSVVGSHTSSLAELFDRCEPYVSQAAFDRSREVLPARRRLLRSSSRRRR